MGRKEFEQKYRKSILEFRDQFRRELAAKREMSNPSFCDDFHDRIMREFNVYQKKKKQILINEIILNRIISKAKLRLYRDRPAAIDAGFCGEIGVIIKKKCKKRRDRDHEK